MQAHICQRTCCLSARYTLGSPDRGHYQAPPTCLLAEDCIPEGIHYSHFCIMDNNAANDPMVYTE